MSGSPSPVLSESLPPPVAAACENAECALAFAADRQQELVRFAGLRLGRYFEWPQQLQACGGPFDVVRLQMEFALRMHRDYMDQSVRWTEELAEFAGPAGPRRANYGEAILKAQADAERIIELAKAQATRIVEEAHRRAAAETPAEDKKRVA